MSAQTRNVVGGEIIAEGRLGTAIHLPQSQHVYDGDRPAAPSAWQEAMTLAEDVMLSAQRDPVAARNLLAGLTSMCRSPETFERHRGLLLGAGIPAAYLPTAAELGRADLV